MGVSCKWTNDSQCFLLENFDLICHSPSQIYHYALPFCPSSSWLQKSYSAELSQAVKVIKGIPAEWGTCFRVVQFDSLPKALAYGNSIIAVGFNSGNIVALDATTGSQVAILCGHTEGTTCLVFSSDGKLLVSGGDDRTIRLWDMQTGGVIRAFNGHTKPIRSISISADCSKIASGSGYTIHLWDVRTGVSLFSEESFYPLDHVHFSSINPKHLLAISYGELCQFDINGNRVESMHCPSYIVPSLGYALFAGCESQDVVVQSFETGGIIAKFHTSQITPSYCCFSPDGKLVAASSRYTTEVWNIVANPYLVETLLGCGGGNVTFSSPSSLISISENDRSVKFWQINVLSTGPTPIDVKTATLASASIVSISLQAKDRVAITSNSTGVVQIWDLSTGICKTSFQSPATRHFLGDAKLVNGRLTFSWCNGSTVFIWESGNNKPPKAVKTAGVSNLMVSGDGSKVFWQNYKTIKVWSVSTRKLVGEVELTWQQEYLDPLHVDGSKIWVRSKNLSTKGWDFGALGSAPVLISNTSSERPCLDFIYGTSWGTGPCLVNNTVTGKEVFRLVGKHAEPCRVKWDGQYLVADYENGEVLIFDFGHLCSQ